MSTFVNFLDEFIHARALTIVIAGKDKLPYNLRSGDIAVHSDENGKSLFMEILKTSKIVPLMVLGLAKEEVVIT